MCRVSFERGSKKANRGESANQYDADGNCAISYDAALKRDGAPFSRLRHQLSDAMPQQLTLKGKPPHEFSQS
ncbi:hypothetical protein FBQ82_03370 [Anaerolineae bacterium CFX7]|nr:hypothetical protein [Anaerolineae bacterium CFX7]RIK34596.1 MAG: hypothetical protein DCC52_00185 [Chloroflexota bacterium]